MLVALLQARGKGFDSDVVDGEWAVVYNRSGKKSPKLQKILQKTEKVKKAYSNFDVSQMRFVNLNYTPRGNGVLQADVQVSHSDGPTVAIGYAFLNPFLTMIVFGCKQFSIRSVQASRRQLLKRR